MFIYNRQQRTISIFVNICIYFYLTYTKAFTWGIKINTWIGYKPANNETLNNLEQNNGPFL